MSQKEIREYLVNNEQDMKNVVIELLSKLKLGGSTAKFEGGAVALALNGDLGTGKTTFTKVLAKELGIEEPITSPTFVIQKSYQIPKQNHKGPISLQTARRGLAVKKLVHIDAYRLENGVDMDVLDFVNTISEQNNLIVIEWAENIKSALPKNAINLNFEYIDDSTRKITIDGILENDGQ
ncbi:MAG: tRNA (adenosine(37)-N6)-threonylcarbamoyltransferase complex ATPase subunit type 1 TsaE [Candidatus Pacebacteria bacterium]|jgi:tRNA threonylcarbamoyladenosine biosynthesis protein TsaE|nr:tRNA (adenosine(37)-N6)-threonylcarbamoyltransferase complex ATPase subunit type 1 TsaE [Candidatus Paceibacterota bacterium]